MSKIIEYLRDFFDTIFGLIDTIFGSINSMIQTCKACISYASDVLSILPGWLYAIVAALITICVIYKILGREGDS